MVVVTSIFVAEIKGHTGFPQTRDEQLLIGDELNALEDARELISLYEGKNRVEPME